MTRRIPKSIVYFFVKAFLLFIVWKVAYLSWLQPRRVLDEPLTQTVGASAKTLLNLSSFSNAYTIRKVEDSVAVEGGMVRGKVAEIYRNGERTLRIADACNGLEMMVLYAGFLLCFPAPWRRKAGYLGIGLLLIFLLNVIRCAVLVWIFIHYNAYLDFSHHFVFTFIVYLFIFLLWYLFTKKLTMHGRPA